MYKKEKSSVSYCTQPVSAKRGWEQKTSVSAAVEGPFIDQQNTRASPSLEAEKCICQDFLSIPLLLRSCVCMSITAQQFGWLLKEEKE